MAYAPYGGAGERTRRVGPSYEEKAQLPPMKLAEDEGLASSHGSANQSMEQPALHPQRQGSLEEAGAVSSPKVEYDSSSNSLRDSKAPSSGKVFQCTGFEGCSMSFSRSEHLARHVRKHTGEKPFTCRCGKKFTRLDNLRQHATTIHADEPEANEELFARLAANMPRSGTRAAKKQSAAVKRPRTPPMDMTSPSVLQGTSAQLYHDPSRFSFHNSLSTSTNSFAAAGQSGGHSFRPYQSAGPTYHGVQRHERDYVHSSRSPSGLHAVPSPSFRFPDPTAGHSLRTSAPSCSNAPRSFQRPWPSDTRESFQQSRFDYERSAAHALSPSSPLPPSLRTAASAWSCRADIYPTEIRHPADAKYAVGISAAPCDSRTRDGSPRDVSFHAWNPSLVGARRHSGSSLRESTGSVFHSPGIPFERRSSATTDASAAAAARRASTASSNGTGSSGLPKPVLPPLSSLMAGASPAGQVTHFDDDHNKARRRSSAHLYQEGDMQPLSHLDRSLLMAVKLATATPEVAEAKRFSVSSNDTSSSVESLAFSSHSLSSSLIASPPQVSAEEYFRSMYMAHRRASFEEKALFAR